MEQIYHHLKQKAEMQVTEFLLELVTVKEGMEAMAAFALFILAPIMLEELRHVQQLEELQVPTKTQARLIQRGPTQLAQQEQLHTTKEQQDNGICSTFKDTIS